MQMTLRVVVVLVVGVSDEVHACRLRCCQVSSKRI